MNTLPFFSAILAMAGLASLVATALAVASRYLEVVEDPRIDNVEQMLPHTNCGACGFPGCRAFASALVEHLGQPAQCTVSSSADHARIAAYLGIAAGSHTKRVARLACAGGSNVARNRAHYEGSPTCAAAALVAGGGKACSWGCLGMADCQRVCDFDAITMDAHHLPVVDEDRCTACGDCVEACPKELFSLHDVDHRLWIACSSLAHGEEILDACEVACTGCGRCAADAPRTITMENSLPVIHYQQGPQNVEMTHSCPTGAIVWLDARQGALKGQCARQVIRQGEIHDTTT